MRPVKKFTLVPTFSDQKENYGVSEKTYSSIIIDDVKPEGYNEINSGVSELASTHEGGGNPLDDFMKFYIQQQDQDKRDIRKEIDEYRRENRDFERRILEDAREREERFRADSKEREERIIMIADEIKADFKSLQGNLDNRLNQFEQKIDSTYKHISSITIAVIGMALATALSVAALVVTVVLTK